MITILFTLKNFQVTILTSSISYLYLRENLKTGITSKENLNSPIIYIAKLHKQILRENRAEICPVFLDLHLIKNNFLLSLEKLTSKELYSIMIFKKNGIPTSQQYFNSLFPDSNLHWKLIYLLPRNISRRTSFRAFQYKILNNVLYLAIIECFFVSENLLIAYVPFVNCTAKL